MKLCVECYKKKYGNRSQLVSLSHKEEICENCKLKKILVTGDHPGNLIMKNRISFLENE